MAKIKKPDMTVMIAEAAYYRAEKRNFEPGYELQDWLEAEQEVLHCTKTVVKLVSNVTPIKAPSPIATKKKKTKVNVVTLAKQTTYEGQTASEV